MSDSYDSFLNEVRNLLPRLYDPVHPISLEMTSALELLRESDDDTVRDVVIRGIKELQPTADVPPQARAWRLYRILCLRYLEQRTQEQAAESVALAVRHLAREQAYAIELLASFLWNRVQHLSTTDTGEALAEVEGAPSGAPGIETTDAWQHQIEREISVLQEYPADDTVDVEEVIGEIARTLQPVAMERGVALVTGPLKPGIVVERHPSLVSQLLVSAIMLTLRRMTTGQMTVSAQEDQAVASITIAATPVATAPSADDWTQLKLLASHSGAEIDHTLEEETLTVGISLSGTRKVTVLVVDDNQDLVHVYRRWTAGTPYRLANVTMGEQVFEQVEALRPALIVLDLMLPDLDGWELLAHLHEHPLSREIPIIVCSVVREDELALALGAVICLHKPVQRHELIQALDQALNG